ncbi:SusC/RagA family TonB-linked outer membrane protein [uncultured Muribaculum sp.]|uniref:SusC/RagA family TonB-linked outer membrane protein n=1 Tax=uncultured Muribaculum sp. TaxID=1918613 RepID=UPI0025E835E4|nr:SusC/RagA family TonB-linked outer membrane protein [uncultured Muribaculum sp.]
MKRIVFFLTAFFALCLTAVAANRTVKGIVVSAEDGEPLVGATVMGAGTTDGTATDIDGQFSLSLPESVKHIKVSYVGMQTKEAAITPGEMRIELNSANMLDEVIAVAFGTAKKSAFTGSAAVLNSEELGKHLTTNVANALVGNVAGLQMRGGSGAPGTDDGKINIRGIASMYGSTDPLVIVDGSPYPVNLSTIPQGDIESITVLKDAASAALYGARGAAGVIIITTKKGDAKQAKVSLDARWGANSRAVQKYDMITEPGEYYEAYYQAMYNYYNHSMGQSPMNAYVNANRGMLQQLYYNVYDVPAGQTLIGQNGKLNPNARLGRTMEYKGQEMYLTPDNWDDLAYRNGFRQEYNVNVNGGTERGSYYASLGYLDEEGVLKHSGYERLTARFKGDFQAKKWLTLGINAGYVHSKTTSNPGLSGTTYGADNVAYYTDLIAPIYPCYVRVIGPDGRPMIKLDEEGRQIYDFGVVNSDQYYGLTRPFGGNGNPIGSNVYNVNQALFNQFNGNFTADFTFTPYLKANIVSSVTWGENELSEYGNSLMGSKQSVNGELKKTTTTDVRTNNIQTITYFNNFDKHHVNALLGHEYYRSERHILMGRATGAFSPDILELNAFAKKETNGSSKSVYNVEGYFVRGQYDYDNKYFASVSYRRDASSRFAKKNRWGNFWSIGLAWIVTEDFFQDLGWIDMLKVKASVGQQGNDGIIDYAYTNTYDITPIDDKHMSASLRLLGNKDITWETTTNWNGGVEFELFDHRLNGSIDLYYKRTTDLLFWLNIPESNGSRGYYDNIGNIRNAGVEVVLNGAIIRSKLIDWSANLNFSHNESKILKLPESKKLYGGFSDSQNSEYLYPTWYQEGKSLYCAYLPKYAGVNSEGQALYYTDSSIDMANTQQRSPATKMDGTTTDSSLAPSYATKSMLPALTGGFGSSLRVGSFDASVQFDFQLGGKVYDYQYQMLMTPPTTANKAGQNFHKDWANAWNPSNTSSNIPRWEYGTFSQGSSISSDRFLTSARYLNFQSFTVGYTLPKFWNEISKIRVYVMGENLCFWSARKGLDPRYSYSGNNGMTPYSPSRNISGGVQVVF